MQREIITRSININTPALLVWDVLTNIDLMKQWMLDTEIDIITDWTVGSSIIIKGDLHGTEFKNIGVILKYQPDIILSYSYLSSLSQLPDELENYTNLEFKLEEQGSQTILTFTSSNFPTETIRQHVGFYWNATLEILKNLVEQLNQSS